MTAQIKPDLYALVETMEVVTQAAKVGLWEQETWINADPITGGAVEWQGRTFCGTAGCFAGWRALLDGGEVQFIEDMSEDGDDEDWLNETLVFPDGSKVHSSAIGAWARRRFGLTEAQSSELFSAENGLDELHTIVREIVIDALDHETIMEPMLTV